jgi:hypothetical protein
MANTKIGLIGVHCHLKGYHYVYHFIISNKGVLPVNGLICYWVLFIWKNKVRLLFLSMDLFWTNNVVAFNMFTVLQIDPILSNFSSWCHILNETMSTGNWICTVWLHPGECNYAIIIYWTARVSKPLHCLVFYICIIIIALIFIFQEHCQRNINFPTYNMIKIYCKFCALFLNNITWLL